MTEVDSYQRQVAAKFQSLLQRQVYNPAVAVSWPAFSGLGRRIYSPKVDIAVGPFATDNNRYGVEYDNMVKSFGNLVDTWIRMFRENWQSQIGARYWTTPYDSPSSYTDFIGVRSNMNARCFVAIEVENETTRKHLMGSIINAGALGRVGILVAWQDKALRAAIRMREYFDFLKQADKRTFDMTGVIVLTRDQLMKSLGI